jgi:hypothetical protein
VGKRHAAVVNREREARRRNLGEGDWACSSWRVAACGRWQLEIGEGYRVWSSGEYIQE